MAPTTVLVVDGHESDRRLVAAMLDVDGHHVIHAADGAHALELVARGGIDIVLLDLPDAIEVCRRIRVACPLISVVVIGATDDSTSRASAKAAGADDLLVKPIHKGELRARVKHLLYLGQHHRRVAAEARSWRLATAVATAVAGSLDAQAVADALVQALEPELDISVVAFANEARGIIAVSPPATGGLDAILAAHQLAELIPMTIPFPDDTVTMYCGRRLPFTDADRALIADLAVHVANAVTTVRMHALSIVHHERAAAALRASEERHRILFDASPMPIWVFDPRTLKLLAVNDALVALLGYTRDELLAMRVADLKPPQDLPQLVDGMSTTSAGRRQHVGVLPYVTKDKRVVELDITSHTTMLGDELAVLALGVDVTRSRKIEAQLQQSQKMDAVGRLAGGIAHDFNNILAAIMGSTDLVLGELGEDHPVATEVREIDRAALHAAGLTRQLLAFSRQQPRKIALVELDAIVATVERMLTRIVGEDIELIVRTTPGIGAVEADAGQLEQVLMNLVVNARDAMPRGGRLTIATSSVDLDEAEAAQLGVATGRFVMLAVSDTGHGMDATTKARIFEPFFTTKEVGRGTGLGLATVFGIVKQSNGAIAVQSVPGDGTTFCIYLPRLARAVSDRAPPDRPRPVAAEQPFRVLLVEDDDRLRAVIGRQLTTWGYELASASNATTAIEMLREPGTLVDLVLTDLVMPGIDGRALAQHVHAERPQIKVLIMSGYPEPPSLAASPALAVPILSKPFTSQQLSAAIHGALDQDQNRLP